MSVSISFLKSPTGLVLILFLFFGNTQPQYSYKIVVIQKACILLEETVLLYILFCNAYYTFARTNFYMFCNVTRSKAGDFLKIVGQFYTGFLMEKIRMLHHKNNISSKQSNCEIWTQVFQNAIFLFETWFFSQGRRGMNYELPFMFYIFGVSYLFIPIWASMSL